MSEKIIKIAPHWESFREQVIAADASDAQVEDMRNAFFGGAHLIMCIVRRIGFEGISEEEGIEQMQSVETELQAFYDDAVKQQLAQQLAERAKNAKNN